MCNVQNTITIKPRICLYYFDTETFNECTFEQRNEIKGTVSKDDINQTYVAKLKDSQLSLDCLWMIEVQSGWQVKLSSL